MKTSELEGAALDWAVGEALTWSQAFINLNYPDGFHPSTNWAHGGELIHRECISIEYMGGAGDGGLDVWVATRVEGPAFAEEQGDTPLEASMRCLVASQLGDKVDIPIRLNRFVFDPERDGPTEFVPPVSLSKLGD